MTIEVSGYTLFHLFSVRGCPQWRLELQFARLQAELELAPKMDRSQIEKISKALGDETRLRIFEAISHSGQMNCGEIVSMRGVTPATVSHHLKILGEAGLITCRREGQFVYSEPVPETIEEYVRALANIAKCKKAARWRS